MEWLALVVWAVIALLAMPVALGSLSGAIGLGLQAVAAIGGLVFVALFIILDGPLWTGWMTVGLAGLGIVTSVWGADRLLSDQRSVNADLQWMEELEAGILGVQIPLFIVGAAVQPVPRRQPRDARLRRPPGTPDARITLTG